MQTKRLIDADQLIDKLQQFADERGWQPFHSARNLMLALTGEVGELAEIFQWLTDEQVESMRHNDAARYQHLQEEVADVLLYLLRLAAVMEIDIDRAVSDKMAKNAIKYPATKI